LEKNTNAVHGLELRHFSDYMPCTGLAWSKIKSDKNL